MINPNAFFFAFSIDQKITLNQIIESYHDPQKSEIEHHSLFWFNKINENLNLHILTLRNETSKILKESSRST
jgi:hypothetical protein